MPSATASKKITNLTNPKRKRIYLMSGFALAFAVVGTSLVIASKAATSGPVHEYLISAKIAQENDPSLKLTKDYMPYLGSVDVLQVDAGKSALIKRMHSSGVYDALDSDASQVAFETCYTLRTVATKNDASRATAVFSNGDTDQKVTVVADGYYRNLCIPGNQKGGRVSVTSGSLLIYQASVQTRSNSPSGTSTVSK